MTVYLVNVVFLRNTYKYLIILKKYIEFFISFHIQHSIVSENINATFESDFKSLCSTEFHGSYCGHCLHSSNHSNYYDNLGLSAPPGAPLRYYFKDSCCNHCFLMQTKQVYQRVSIYAATELFMISIVMVT